MAATTITFRTDPELVRKITAIAATMDRSLNWVIQEALRQYVDAQLWQIEGIKEANGSLDAGEGVPHEQVMAEAEALIAKLDSAR